MANPIQTPRFSVAINSAQYQDMIRSTLSDPNRANRFIASITSAVAVNPALQECAASSILAGALLGESLGLSPSPQLGQYYLVPFNVTRKGEDGKTYKVKQAQFVIGYRGFIQLLLRSGIYTDIDAMEIKQGEYLGRDEETGKFRFKFVADDCVRDKLPTVGYMSRFETKDGFKKVLYWPHEKMLEHADRCSPAFSAKAFKSIQAGEVQEKDMWKYSSFWYKDFSAMALKTMIRQIASKWGSQSIVPALEKDHGFAYPDFRSNTIIEMPESPEMFPDWNAPADNSSYPDSVESGSEDGVGGVVGLSELE